MGVTGIGVGIGIGPFDLGGASAFSPLSLFAGSEEGAWYDPSDLNTMFQDRYCTTPVTADSQPVGAIFDKSQGLALGPELLTNPGGPFTATTGWAVQSGGVLSVVDGKLRIVCLDADNIAGASHAVTLTSGDLYYMEVEIASVSPAGEGGRLGYTDQPTGTFLHDMNKVFNGTTDDAISVRTYSGYFIAGAGPHHLSVALFSNTPGEDGIVEVSRASVKRVLGAHASQATAAARPLYKTSGGLHWLEFDGVDDGLSVPGLATLFSAASQKSVALAVEAIDNPGILIANSSSSPFVFVYESGSALSVHSAGITANSARVNGSPTTLTTRDHAYTSFGSLGVVVADFTTLALSWTTPILGASYTNASYAANTKWYGVVIRDTSMTGGDAEAVETYLAKKSGVTL